LIDRLRAWLEPNGAEAAWVSDPVSIAYLTGFSAEPHERLMGLAIGPGGSVLVVPGLEQESAERQTRGVEVVAWSDGTNPYTAAAGALGRVGRLAVEKHHLTLAVAERLQEVAGTGELVDIGASIRELRRRKSPEELELLQRAAEITDRVTAAILGSLRAGQTELEVASRINSLIGAEGAVPSFETIVQSGPNSAEPHARPSSRALAPGDFVLLDFGAAWRGYKADITRTVLVGEPDDRQREVYQAVLEAHDVALDRVRAGATAGDVDAAARVVIARAGYGDQFIHRVGHGLGLEVHEDPSLDPGSGVELELGMVITVEPGIYVPGWGGVRIEDDAVVEADRGRPLTGADRSLRSVH
jgi:Xaa-Pro aminopeptidase